MKRLVLVTIAAAIACGQPEVAVHANPSDAPRARVIAKLFALGDLPEVTADDVERILETHVTNRRPSPYRVDLAFADTPAATNVELATGANGWAALTLVPGEGLHVFDMVDRLLDLPYAPGTLTYHHSDRLELRIYHRFGVPAGEIDIHMKPGSADDIDTITIVWHSDDARSAPLVHTWRWWRDWWANAK